MTVITTEDLVGNKGLSFHIQDSQTEVIFDDSLLQNVAAVWYRKPNNFERVDVPVNKAFEKYARTSLDSHFRQLRVQFDDAKWVSDYYAIARAENKTFQLRLAAKLGFMMPETLFTSSSEAAQNFLQKYPSIIVKTLAKAFPADDKQSYYFFARRITSEQRSLVKNLHLTPAIFQQAIDVAADVRVTIVGDTVFAAKVVVDNNDHKPHPIRDWRHEYYYDRVVFEKYVLPADIKSACLRLVKELGLQYGAIDLVVDKSNKIWFLEINPNGQWAFIEEDTGLPIGKTLARLLAS